MRHRFGDELSTGFETQGGQHKRHASDVVNQYGGQGVSDWPMVFALGTVHRQGLSFVRKARLRIRSARAAHGVQVP